MESVLWNLDDGLLTHLASRFLDVASLCTFSLTCSRFNRCCGPIRRDQLVNGFHFAIECAARGYDGLLVWACQELGVVIADSLVLQEAVDWNQTAIVDLILSLPSSLFSQDLTKYLDVDMRAKQGDFTMARRFCQRISPVTVAYAFHFGRVELACQLACQSSWLKSSFYDCPKEAIEVIAMQGDLNSFLHFISVVHSRSGVGDVLYTSAIKYFVDYSIEIPYFILSFIRSQIKFGKDCSEAVAKLRELKNGQLSEDQVRRIQIKIAKFARMEILSVLIDRFPMHFSNDSFLLDPENIIRIIENCHIGLLREIWLTNGKGLREMFSMSQWHIRFFAAAVFGPSRKSNGSIVAYPLRALDVDPSQYILQREGIVELVIEIAGVPQPSWMDDNLTFDDFNAHVTLDYLQRLKSKYDIASWPIWGSYNTNLFCFSTDEIKPLRRLSGDVIRFVMKDLPGFQGAFSYEPFHDLIQTYGNNFSTNDLAVAWSRGPYNDSEWDPTEALAETLSRPYHDIFFLSRDRNIGSITSDKIEGIYFRKHPDRRLLNQEIVDAFRCAREAEKRVKWLEAETDCHLDDRIAEVLRLTARLSLFRFSDFDFDIHMRPNSLLMWVTRCFPSSASCFWRRSLLYGIANFVFSVLMGFLLIIRGRESVQ